MASCERERERERERDGGLLSLTPFWAYIREPVRNCLGLHHIFQFAPYLLNAH